MLTLAKLGTVGVFAYRSMATVETATELEQLGYRALWLGDTGADLDVVEHLLAATERLVVGSYVVNIWAVPAKVVAASFHRFETVFPGRFVLGIGAGHPEVNSDYHQPYQAVVTYLDELDEMGVPTQRRALAALGPRMLELAGARTAGTLPFLITPAYIRATRVSLGPQRLVVAAQTVVLSDDPQSARALGRSGLGPYLGLSNVVANLRRLGFTDEDLTPPGSDRLVDTLAAHGSADAIAARLRAHLDAGADHVVVQAFTPDNDILPAFRALAGNV